MAVTEVVCAVQFSTRVCRRFLIYFSMVERVCSVPLPSALLLYFFGSMASCFVSQHENKQAKDVAGSKTYWLSCYHLRTLWRSSEMKTRCPRPANDPNTWQRFVL